MKKRWFVVILTIGLLLHVLPLSVLALSPDPTITDSDGTILDWSDLSTVPYSLDDLQEQEPPVPDLSETGSEKSPADAGSDKAAADDLPAGNPTPKTLDKGPGDDDLADADRDEATDDRPTVNLTPKIPDEESDDDGSADDDGSTTTPPVCKIGDIYYSTLDEAISMAIPGDQIDLLKNIELDEGLTFDNKTLTISGGGTHKLTLKGIGIYASGSNITFENLTLHIYAHIHPNQNGGAANLITSTNLRLDDVNFELISDTPNANGAGLYMERGSNLYLDNGTYAVIRDFNGYDASGIYAEQTNYDPNEGKIEINSSYLEVTGCYHAGLLIDPLDLTLTSSEVVLEKNGCHGYGFGLACYDGKVTLLSSTIKATENNTGGSYGFGVFAGELEVDGDSTLIASDNGVGGLGVGAESVICGGAKVFCERNGASDPGCAGGLVVHAEHYDDSTYEGKLTIESGAYVYACNNVGLAGLLNEWILNIESGATVIVDGNSQLGFANSFDARTTIKSGANVSANNNLYGIYNYAGGGDLSVATGFFLIEGGAHVTANNNRSCGIFNTVYDNFDTPADDYFTIQSGAVISADGNGGHGIYNDGGIFTVETGAIVSACNNGYYGIFNNKGTFTVENGVDLQVEYNKESGVVNVENSKLTLLSGCVRYNTTNDLYGYGGGLRNLGTAILSDDVELYNNHAKFAGDDIYNADGATITFGDTGKGWELDGGPDCYDFITGWYDDRSSARWNAHGDDESARHIVLVQPGTELTGFLALKAAHGSTGSLTVCKETVGELLPSDYDTVFTFELTLDDDAITTIDDKWCGVPFKNGKTSFTLKSGESITLSNLPAGIGYTITETAQDGWTLLNLNPAETGVVPQNDTAKVVFTNLKNSPDDPYVPVVPVDPETPEIPEEPEGPETPEEPEEPEIPEETEETEETEAPGELPAEEPAQTDTSASLAQPEETPTQNTTTVTLIQTGTTDWLAAVLLIFGIGLLVCGWFFDRKQRAAKH